MKKFKVLIITIICALCLCFAFAGCSSGSFVKDSFECVISDYSSSEDKVVCSFEVKIKDNKDYDADYVITKKSKDGKITEKFGYNISLSKPVDGKVTVTRSFYVYPIIYGDEGYIVELASVRVYPDNGEDKSVGYAIGFGVTGGVILCGVAVYFIVDKLVLSKKKDD